MEKKIGAGNEIRTRDLNLGKVALYQLSYSRIKWRPLGGSNPCSRRERADYRVNGLEAETILKDRLIEISRVEHLILSLKPELILVDNLSYFSKFKIDFEKTFEVHSRAQDLIRVTEYRHQIGLSEDVKDLELSYLREADAWQKNRHP